MSILKIERLEKKIKKLEAKLELNEQIKEMELSLLNDHWAEKFSLIVDMFEAQLNEDIEIEENVFRPQNLNDFKKWFSAWTEDINSIDANSPDAGEQMGDIIEKHGFTFVARKPQMQINYREILGGDYK
jgi:hypothetical protein